MPERQDSYNPYDMSKRLILTTISFIALASILTAVVIKGTRKDRHVKEEEKIIRLNDTLTNAMSDIPELYGLDKKIN